MATAIQNPVPISPIERPAKIEEQDSVDSHYVFRDWPNEAGFQTLHEERTPIELQTIGSIPPYAAGMLYRTGPASYKVPLLNRKELSCDHWFDGFGHTHRFQIIKQENGSMKVFYNSRRANDGLREMLKSTGKYKFTTFGQKRDPCIGIFGKVMTVFESPHPTKDPSVANVSVTARPNMPGQRSAGKDEKLGHLPVRNLWAMTDSASLKELDPSTLEPIGLSSQKALHPDLKGPLSCAHTMSDPATGDVYNYNLALGPNPTYRMFRTSAATGETEILAVLSGKGVKPAYLHSFFMTEDFVILCIWNAHFSHMGLKILSEQNLLDAISPFDKSEPNRWFVVDRKHGDGLVAEFQSPAAFCFHTVNAWQVENDGKTDIMCEYVEYENTDVLHSLYYSNLLSSSEQAVTFNDEKGESSLGCLTQYRLSDIGNSPLKRGKDIPTAERVLQIPKRMAGDLPTINPNFEMKESRYVYTTIHRGFSAFVDGLSKVDTVTKEVAYWDNQKGHTPGEAIFVPDPEGADEDDGVLLSVVLDGFKETSYLVCLDARTMKEIGRADCGCPVGFGFHGAHIKA